MNWKRYLPLFVLSPLFLVIPPPQVEAASVTMKPIVIQGDPAPGGGTFVFISGFSFNEVGTVAFHAGVRRGVQSSDGIFSWVDGTITPVVQSGDPALGGRAFLNFLTPSVNRSGAVAFGAVMTRTREEFFDPVTPTGIFLASGGAVSPIVRPFDPYPFDALFDLDPARVFRFQDFAKPSLNDASAIVFRARKPTGGTVLSQDDRLFLASGGTLRHIVRGRTFTSTPEQVPGHAAPGGGTFTRFLLLFDEELPSINNRGAIAFLAETETPFHRGLYLADPSGPVAFIAREGDPAPQVHPTVSAVGG